MGKIYETVDGISEMLGVKPAGAYRLARLWEASGGEVGIPCIRLGVGRQLRFSRVDVEEFLHRQGQKVVNEMEIEKDGR